MKKLILSLFLLFTVVIFNSCSSGTTAGGQVNPNTVGTPFTLKYEIITSSPVVLLNNSAPIVAFVNSTGQLEQDNSFTSGTTWTKEITVTTSNRPFYVVLNTVINNINISAPGTSIGNIYVNGRQVAHVENPTISGGGINSALVQMSYYVY